MSDETPEKVINDPSFAYLFYPLTVYLPFLFPFIFPLSSPFLPGERTGEKHLIKCTSKGSKERNLNQSHLLITLSSNCDIQDLTNKSFLRTYFAKRILHWRVYRNFLQILTFILVIAFWLIMVSLLQTDQCSIQLKTSFRSDICININFIALNTQQNNMIISAKFLIQVNSQSFE